jgi:hypothetical protein
MKVKNDQKLLVMSLYYCQSLNFDGPINFHDMLLDVERALENLPNRVIDNVKVNNMNMNNYYSLI